jgi:hypothetical protein
LGREPGKPGYVDECPACLHERTHPPVPKNFEERYLERFPNERKAFRDTKKYMMMKLGLSEEDFRRVMSEALNKAGTHIRDHSGVECEQQPS